MEKINLNEIVQREDFRRELNRAAALSYDYNKESGFCAWTNEKYEKINVNEAVQGGDRTIETDLTEEAYHEEGKGCHIPSECYRVVFVHFHPPKDHLRPSPADIKDILEARRINQNLRDFAEELHKEVYDKNNISKGYKVKFINPVSITGLVKKPGEMELLIYQGSTKKTAEIEDFNKFAADYYNKLYGQKGSGWGIKTTRYHFRFKSPKRVVDFLKTSRYFQAENIRVGKEELSKKAKEKLEKFKLIQTKFFPQGKWIEYWESLFEQV